MTASTYSAESLSKENSRKIPKYYGKYIHIDMLAIFLYTWFSLPELKNNVNNIE